MSRPTKGLAAAIDSAPIDSERAMLPRLQSKAPASGFMKTPTLISTTEVEQQTVPSIAIQTTNQAARLNALSL